MTLQTAIVILTLLPTLAACSQPKMTSNFPPHFAEACAVTVLALTSNTSDDRPWILDEGPPRTGVLRPNEEVVLQAPLPGEDPDEYLGWHTSSPDGMPLRTGGPSAEMAKAFALTQPANALSCSEVKIRAERANERFADTDQNSRPVDADAAFSRTEVELDRAIVSPDGQEAIVYLGQQFAPLAGGGFLILYRKDSQGAWREAARLSTWIS